jgi:hypothetical protein
MPLVIDAYGTGAAPVIRGGAAEEGLRLFNQEFWEISNLEIVGGYRYGLHVSGDKPDSTLTHIYLRNLDVHGASYVSTKRADSGEVVVQTSAKGQVLHDVLVDGVTAHDSRVSEGIFVSAGGSWIEGGGVSQPLGSNVTVRNSVAHDVYGDGILISELTDGLLEHNVVYRSGLCPTCTGSTPVGLWEWYCQRCMVQFNESYANDSWDGDGGDFDIDYYNDDNIVQYNYGHDSAGYCVAVFGAGGRASHHNIVRYNLCSNNGRKPSLSKQGEIFLHTWEGGSLDGVEIYNNTFYWNPAENAPALSALDATYSGQGPLFFKNNIVYATVPGMIEAPAALMLDHNIYWTTSQSPATWRIDGTTYAGFPEYQQKSGKDVQSAYLDPKMADPTYHATGRPQTACHLEPDSAAFRRGVDICRNLHPCSVGSQDFWGNPLGGTFNIGAYQGR